MDARIAAAREELGTDVVMLGHHYQRDEVIRFADYTGDSYKLSKVAEQSSAKYMVFCGVHIMAETADVLARPWQQVILPDLNAGCSMADMAETGQVEDCWDSLERQGVGAEGLEVEGSGLEGGLAGLIPITYMRRSAAAIKARFVGSAAGWFVLRRMRVRRSSGRLLVRERFCFCPISIWDGTPRLPWGFR